MSGAKEKLMRALFLLSACVSVLSVALICIFLFKSAFPAISQIGLTQFLFGREWAPGNGKYGIFPMILGSIYATGGAVVTGVPLGILTAVYLARFCPDRLCRRLKPALDLLSGIPSIVYGFFGLMALVPAVRVVFGGSGKSLLTASLLLGIMILPTVISVSYAALRAVPESYYEGALALGATHERAVFRTVLPAARSGVMAAVVLGIGRAIGETMAVIMVAGNQTAMPSSLLAGLRTMTANIVIEMGYAEGLHREALFATGAVLFVFILIINLLLNCLKRGGESE
jgi:phosphate transport system permease protein